MRKHELEFIETSEEWIDEYISENPIFDEETSIIFGKSENLEFELDIKFALWTVNYEPSNDPDNHEIAKRLRYVELLSVKIDGVATSTAFDKWVLNQVECAGCDILER